MIPLSFASILGGTCTLIGTSTNLVVLGMLNDWTPTGSDGEGTTKHTMGLFDLGLYGVPCALSGMCYILLASRSLLPGGRTAAASRSNSSARDAGGGRRGEDLIVGARLQA
jgi:di/tricarboxylate transporter